MIFLLTCHVDALSSAEHCDHLAICRNFSSSKSGQDGFCVNTTPSWPRAPPLFACYLLFSARYMITLSQDRIQQDRSIEFHLEMGENLLFGCCRAGRCKNVKSSCFHEREQAQRRSSRFFYATLPIRNYRFGNIKVAGENRL